MTIGKELSIPGDQLPENGETQQDVEQSGSAERALEAIRTQFSPELQNIVATLIAAFEPISFAFIAHLSDNADGMSRGNKVAVTPDDAAMVIRVFQEAERRYGVKMIETGPVIGSEDIPANTETTDVLSNTTVTSPQSALSQMGYKFTSEVQEFVKNRYPQLYSDTHGQVASRMWFDLFGESIDAETEAQPEAKSEENLLPPGEQIGKLADDAAQEIKKLGSGE